MVGRLLFLLIGSVLGMTFGWSITGQDLNGIVIGASVGLGISGILLGFEYKLKTLPFPIVFWGGIGLFTGLLGAAILGQLLGIFQSVSESPFSAVVIMGLFLSLPFFGVTMGCRYGRDGLAGLAGGGNGESLEHSVKLLDTSVIIDGRIADLCETGFIEGRLVVPHFILQELQHISDSSDGLKRARGRRGLDILNVIQKMTSIKVDLIEDDFPHVKEVDTKLIELAKQMDAKVLTNDFNLNKVAGIQGVKVLNINDLCNALKPVVLPGETIRVFVLKEGKEAGQGVAYLDDGTMVVVDHAKKWIGKNVEVVVTSVLQTSAGRMIFTRLKEESEREELSFARV